MSGCDYRSCRKQNIDGLGSSKAWLALSAQQLIPFAAMQDLVLPGFYFSSVKPPSCTTLWVERKVCRRGREEQNGGKARGFYDSQQGGVLELTDQDWMPLPKVGLRLVVTLCLPDNNPSVYLAKVLLFRAFSSAQPF